MKERIEVYESLRNEIIAIGETQRNVWIYMYVQFCVLFVLGLQWSYNFFLITYIILIPFQCVINDYRYSITKLSTYIRVFFEENYDDMGWESLQIYRPFLKHSKMRRKSISCRISQSGAIHLGLMSTGGYCVLTFVDANKNNNFVLGWENIILIVASIALLILLFVLNRKYYNDNRAELEYIIRKYKKKSKK